MSKARELLQKVLHLHAGSGHPGAFVVENLMNEIRDYLSEKEKFEVVMWQSRCRAATFDKKDNWYPWEECTAAVLLCALMVLDLCP